MVISGSQYFLSRLKMMALLTELEATGDTGARSLYLPHGLSPQEIEHSLAEVFSPQVVPDGLAKLSADSKTGACLYRGTMRKCLVLPPFPVTEKALFHGYNVAPLLSRLRTDFKIAFILVRLGAYAVGVCRGETLVSSKVGTGLVHGRHKKGGSSQGRFRRHREKQIEYFLGRVCSRIQEYIMPEAGSLDYVVYGGAWTTLQLLEGRCPSVKQLAKPILPPLLDIPEPRHAVLVAAIKRTWSSYLIEWSEDEEASR
ncbi:MAG: hypothetical protein IIB13_07095 [Chloroflexi bacterium]|nr:hypothetical protein [Chloroflexota bacterium]